MNPFTYKNKRKTDYFEGWYFRITDIEKGVNSAFIFALTKNTDDPHAFIQYFDGANNRSHYYRYDTNEFSFKDDTVKIAGNVLSEDKMYLKTNDIEVNVVISSKQKLHKKLLSNSAMSYLHIFPLECFQEVVLMDGVVEGTYKKKDKELSVKGKTYIEKTFGYKFPKRWIWIQSNHFDQDVTFSFSLGEIPVFNKLVTGFFLIVTYQNKEYKFGSYNFSKIRITEISGNNIKMIAKHGRYKLEIEAISDNPVTLIGPIENGKMVLDVFESITSTLSLKLTKSKKLVFQSNGTSVGMENMYEY